MTSLRWRCCLLALLLAALPLRGWAALGLMACCLPDAHVATQADPGMHAHPATAQPTAPHADGAPLANPSDTPGTALAPVAAPAAHHGADSGAHSMADKAPPPCCGAAAIMASLPGLSLAPTGSAGLGVAPAQHYRSALLAVQDKPPRT